MNTVRLILKEFIGMFIDDGSLASLALVLIALITVAVAFLASQLFSAQTLTQRTMGHALELAPAQWRFLNTTWVVTFAAIGAINLFVMYNYDQATWVTFKVWGQMGLLLVAVVVQAIWISRHMPQSDADKSG